MSDNIVFEKKCPVCGTKIEGLRASRKIYCSVAHKDQAANAKKDWKAVNDGRKEYLKEYRKKIRAGTTQDVCKCGTNDSCLCKKAEIQGE
jgi:reverse gyrase